MIITIMSLIMMVTVTCRRSTVNTSGIRECATVVSINDLQIQPSHPTGLSRLLHFMSPNSCRHPGDCKEFDGRGGDGGDE